MIILMTFLSSCWTCTHSHNALRDRLESSHTRVATAAKKDKSAAPVRVPIHSLRLKSVREVGHCFTIAADAGFADFAMAAMNSN
jgi:hypothetical protein